jgi:antirestriction protein ArdC
MSRHTARTPSGSDRTNLYDEITAKIIAELKARRVPLGPLGNDGDEGAARHAKERRHRPAILRYQRADPLTLPQTDRRE